MDLHACLPSRKRERDPFLRSKLDKRPCAQLAFVDQANVRVLQGKKVGCFRKPAWPAVCNDLLPILPTDPLYGHP